jgi:hypothetical protein
MTWYSASDKLGRSLRGMRVTGREFGGAAWESQVELLGLGARRRTSRVSRRKCVEEMANEAIDISSFVSYCTSDTL